MTAYTKTSPGAPVGRYVKDDTVTDSAGVVWVCTVTGNPAQFDVQAAAAPDAPDAPAVSFTPTSAYFAASVDQVAEALDDAMNRAAGAVDADGPRVLTVRDSGKTFLLKNHTGNFTLPLAATSLGTKFRFVLYDELTGDVTITTSTMSETFEGYVFNIQSAARVAGAGGDVLTFALIAAIEGDWVELQSVGGAGWVVTGVVANTGAVAFS